MDIKKEVLWKELGKESGKKLKGVQFILLLPDRAMMVLQQVMISQGMLKEVWKILTLVSATNALSAASASAASASAASALAPSASAQCIGSVRWH